MKKTGNYKRTIALVVAVCVLTGAAATVLAVNLPPVQQAMANAAASQADRETAQEISDMTGVTPYRLLEMKRDKGDWNRVIEGLEQGEKAGSEDLSSEELTALLAAFTHEEVESAEALVSRIVFALREIVSRQESETFTQPAVPTLAPAGEQAEEERDFAALEGKFQKNRAIWLVLATTGAKGTQQSALDEYLYSLQTDVDYELFLTDVDEYEKQVAQQGAALMREQAITTMEIEQKLIELLSGANLQPNDTGGNAAPSAAPDAPGVSQTPSPAGSVLPGSLDSPSQNGIQLPSPPRPGAEVYKELERIQRESGPNTGRTIGGEVE